MGNYTTVFFTDRLKKLILLMTIIAGLIIVSGYFYYRELNRAEDPRIIDARRKMAEYNDLISENETALALLLLDQVEALFAKTPGYAESYETGVIYNNRGSIFLTQAETNMINKKEPDPGILRKAKAHISKSIEIYTRWLKKIAPLECDQVRAMILPYFPHHDPVFDNLNLNKIIDKRVDDIIFSKIETKRRMSVSYTNLGIVLRYEGNLEEAKNYYEKALKLWPDNHVAKNNLNMLMGLPPEKRNFIKQLFFKKRAARS